MKLAGFGAHGARPGGRVFADAGWGRHKIAGSRWTLFGVLIIVAVVAAASVWVSLPSSPAPVGVPGSWNLVFDTEFDGSSLDTSVWRPDWFRNGISGPINGSEAACYSPDNVTFPGDGTAHLDLTARPVTCQGMTEPYTGAVLSTNPDDGRAGGGFQFTYGVVEAKIYVPANGDAIADWPGIFTTGQHWPEDGEDDIMEGLRGRLCFHFHDPEGGPGGCDDRMTAGWHTFASDWEPGSVTYYYDGIQVGQITKGITSAPMYLGLDNTVSAGRPSIVDAMRVAYVRVWQQS